MMKVGNLEKLRITFKAKRPLANVSVVTHMSKRQTAKPRFLLRIGLPLAARVVHDTSMTIHFIMENKTALINIRS